MNVIRVLFIQDINFLIHFSPFCRVWLKNEYDAQIMEFELKGSFMGGKKLLVARAEKLLNGSV